MVNFYLLTYLLTTLTILSSLLHLLTCNQPSFRAKTINIQYCIAKRVANKPQGGGGTCENFDRDARVIFLGLKFTKISLFWESLSWCHFLGLKKLPSFFWVN